METLDHKEKFIEMRARGYSFDRIARELGRAKQTLIDWSKDLQEEIANLKAMELEALYEKYYLLRETRIQTFGEMLQKIKREVARRNLKDIPTDKLLDLYLKYNTLVKDELVEPSFRSSREIAEGEAERELLSQATGTAPRGRLKAV